MEKKIFLFLATGFEESEAVGTLDVLRRGGIDAKFVSIYDHKEVVGSHGITIVADELIANVKEELVDAIVLPGGLPGSTNLSESKELEQVIRRHYEAGKKLCAICAAPLVFGKMGLLRGISATCYPGFEVHLDGSMYTAQAVTSDHQFITGRGPAYAYDFGLAILFELLGKDKAKEVSDGLLMSISKWQDCRI